MTRPVCKPLFGVEPCGSATRHSTGLNALTKIFTHNVQTTSSSVGPAGAAFPAPAIDSAPELSGDQDSTEL